MDSLGLFQGAARFTLTLDMTHTQTWTLPSILGCRWTEEDVVSAQTQSSLKPHTARESSIHPKPTCVTNTSACGRSRRLGVWIRAFASLLGQPLVDVALRSAGVGLCPGTAPQPVSGADSAPALSLQPLLGGLLGSLQKGGKRDTV